MPTILAIDDTPEILAFFQVLFDGTPHRVIKAADGTDALRLFNDERPDLVFLDVHLPDISGIDLLKRFRELDRQVPIVIMTGHGNPELVIDAMQIGAIDYVSKPLRRDAVKKIADQALKHAHAGAVADMEVKAGEESGAFLGRSPSMEEVYKSIGRVAATDACVLILGESGTGKELAARTIWRRSQRADLPFLAVNCAALTDSLLESELFGHEQGAFTGADKRRAGFFEQCQNGTLFLDEIGDMRLTTQAKILRVLQEQEFFRVGGQHSIRTNVRIIAATNRDLHDLVERGEYRKDLYYRLNTFAVQLPPLRERAGDIPLLAQHFLRECSTKYQRRVQGFTREAMQLLEGYSWPGNVRELQAAVVHAVLHTSGAMITPNAIREELRAAAPTDIQGVEPCDDMLCYIRSRLQLDKNNLYDDAVAVLEKQLFREVLQFTNNNQSLAARILGLSRPTLRKKLQTHDLH